MKDNKFDKIIGDKLRQIEVEPANGIFRKIMTGRMQNGLFNNDIVKSWLLIASSIVLVSGWIISHKVHNPEVLSDNQTVEKVYHDKILNQQELKFSSELPMKDEPVIINSKNSLEKELKNHKKSESEPDLVKTVYPKVKSDLSNQPTTDKLVMIENQSETTETVYLSKAEISFRQYDGLIPVDYSELVSYNSTVDLTEIRKLSKPKSRLKEIELFYGYGTWKMNNLDEKMKESLSSNYYSELGVRLHLPIANNFNLLTGIQWQQIQSRFNHIYEEKSTLTQIDTFNGVIIDPVGNPQTITRYDTSYNELINEYKTSGKNQYTLINLPIGIEFSKAFKKGAIYGNMAVLVRINSVQKGYWLDSDINEPFPVNIKGNANQLTGNIGLSGGIGYLYHFNPRFSLGLEPNFNLYSVSTLPTNVKANGKLWNLGLRTGLRYNF